MNSIGGDTLQMLKTALAEVEKNFVGLVVGNQGANFSVGANLMLVLLGAQEEEWDEIDLGDPRLPAGDDVACATRPSRWSSRRSR